jgi:hypothetical protein
LLFRITEKISDPTERSRRRSLLEQEKMQLESMENASVIGQLESRIKELEKINQGYQEELQQISNGMTAISKASKKSDKMQKIEESMKEKYLI